MRTLTIGIMLVGCGGSGGGTVAIGDFGGDIGKATCTKIFACCTQAEISAQLQSTTITTEAGCESYVGGLFDGFVLPEYQASIAAGRLEYNGDAAGACIAAIDGLSCTEYSTDMSSDMFAAVGGCEPFLIAKVGDGGACTQSYECTSNNCVGATVTQTSSTDGACMPIPTTGEPCTANCSTGLYCGLDDTSGTETCQPIKADGAACDANDECISGSCTGGTTCATTGSVCNGT